MTNRKYFTSLFVCFVCLFVFASRSKCRKCWTPCSSAPSAAATTSSDRATTATISTSSTGRHRVSFLRSWRTRGIATFQWAQKWKEAKRVGRVRLVGRGSVAPIGPFRLGGQPRPDCRTLREYDGVSDAGRRSGAPIGRSPLAPWSERSDWLPLVKRPSVVQLATLPSTRTELVLMLVSIFFIGPAGRSTFSWRPKRTTSRGRSAATTAPAVSANWRSCTTCPGPPPSRYVHRVPACCSVFQCPLLFLFSSLLSVEKLDTSIPAKKGNPYSTRDEN